MEQCIPPLKELVTENLDLFNDVYAIFSEERTPEISLFEQNENGDIIVHIKEDGALDFTVDKEPFSRTQILSEGEKKKVIELLNLTHERLSVDMPPESISINSFGRGPMMVASRNLVDLRLAHLDSEEAVALISETAHYVEKLADGWYAYIVVSKPL